MPFNLEISTEYRKTTIFINNIDKYTYYLVSALHQKHIPEGALWNLKRIDDVIELVFCLPVSCFVFICDKCYVTLLVSLERLVPGNGFFMWRLKIIDPANAPCSKAVNLGDVNSTIYIYTLSWINLTSGIMHTWIDLPDTRLWAERRGSRESEKLF